MPDGDHQFGVVKILQRDGAFPYPDRAGQADAGGLMAHVGAVREIIGAQFAGEQLIQERRFVRGAPGGVKLHLIRRKIAQYLPDTGKGVVPLYRAKGVASGIVLHGMGQTAIAFQLKIAFRPQVTDGVRREKVGRDALRGRFPRHRFGPVLAKLEGGFVFFIRPGAARAVKAVGLVGAQQRGGGVKGIHLRAHGDCRRL